MAGAQAAATTTAAPTAESAGKPAALATPPAQVGSAPTEESQKISGTPGGIFGALMKYTALPAGIFWFGGYKVTMLVDSGATEHFVDCLLYTSPSPRD